MVRLSTRTRLHGAYAYVIYTYYIYLHTSGIYYNMYICVTHTHTNRNYIIYIHYAPTGTGETIMYIYTHYVGKDKSGVEGLRSVVRRVVWL